MNEQQDSNGERQDYPPSTRPATWAAAPPGSPNMKNTNLQDFGECAAKDTRVTIV